MPDRTNAILTGQKETFLQAITADVKALEQMGVANIAIPCNTSHYYIEEIQASTQVPLINMVKESVFHVQNTYPNAKKIGILATDGTMHAKVYHQACQKAGLIAVSPEDEAQKAVMSLIYDDIKGGKQGEPQKFQLAYENLMNQGCDVILLACTELSVYKEYHPVPSNCVDAMDVLVRESVLRSGAQIREKK